jgi:hypothetical protein
LIYLKQLLKKYIFIYAQIYKCRRWQQDRQIYKEQRKYEKIAVEKGIPMGEENPDEIFTRLRKRLEQRGIGWPPIPEERPLHILYASVPGNWERHNIPSELLKLGEASFFFLEDQNISLNQGWAVVRRQVDDRLPGFIEKLHKVHPVDLMLSYLSGSQIFPKTIQRIGRLGIPTFSFHLDDRRSFRGVNYGGQWSGPIAVCRAYDLNLTNALASLIKYRVEGANVIFWPEGANSEFFRPLDLPFKYEVSFCGQRYGERPLLVDYLRRQGIRVDCFGQDWEHGYQSEENLVRIFNQSRINLGFGYVNESTDQCLKGRDFEIPACGALYVTSHNENLNRVYRIGQEIETYTDYADCAAKIKGLLADTGRCEFLQNAARKAVLDRHTWSARVHQLLTCTGVPLPNGSKVS